MTTLNSVPSVVLNNGVDMPQLGLGVWQATDDEAQAAVKFAIDEAGYRHIDTAAIYGNEKGVGRALAQVEVPRDQIFVTTKLWNADQGYESALKACETSLGKLGLDYVDLYLIHWPYPTKGLWTESWRALETLLHDGKARAIGVCNAKPHHLQEIFDSGTVVPAVNQIELHPHLPQYVARAFDAAHGIATESWSPLGGTPSSGWGADSKPNTLLTDPVIAEIAKAHQVSPAQVLIRWHIENGLIVIPKSVHPDRIKGNIDVFDFSLTGAEFQAIGALNDGQRVGTDPDVANFE